MMQMTWISTLCLAAMALVPTAGRTITADSFQSSHEITLTLDGDTATYWSTAVEVPYPHHVILDLEQTALLNGFTYLPRQDASMNGNIGQFMIEVSVNHVVWSTVASGNWGDDQSLKWSGFSNVLARYVRLTALTEAGDRGAWATAAEFDVSVAVTDVNHGLWDPVIEFPLVPAAAFLLPTTGQVLMFSSFRWNDWNYPYNGLGYNGSTITAIWDPKSAHLSEYNVTGTQHDMFCPGLSLDGDGCAVVTGGDDSRKTSIFCAEDKSWKRGAQLKIPRGYQSSATLSDGRIFTIGGSWSGPQTMLKNAEIYNSTADSWMYMPDCLVAPMLTNDLEGMHRQDNHAWLFGWKNGSVFQAGPSSKMNWYGTIGNGTQIPAGLRASDPDSMNGNAVMFDAVNGKILTVGGSADYTNSTATSHAHLITIGEPYTLPTVLALPAMQYQRAFANAVILPDGKIFVTGGQSYAVPFTDTYASLYSEIWDPETQIFITVAPHSIPRTYHSVALLLLDGTVFTGGGGLCGNCTKNHPSGQIYRPRYLFTDTGGIAQRPLISSLSSETVHVGRDFDIETDLPITDISLIRYGSVTHTVNTDQRRIVPEYCALKKDKGSYTYRITVPIDPGIALAGYWMVFVLKDGVPSEAKTIHLLGT